MSKYHTFWNRLFAGLIDGLIFSSLTLADDYLDLSNKFIFVIWTIINAALGITYSVYFHGRYGQTIGKIALNIKVVDVDENSKIGYKRALYRESIWIAIELITIIYFIMLSWNSIRVNEQIIADYETAVGFLAIGFLFIELTTMLFNQKRRAIHDYIANSVVIKD